ncbi:MAG: AAA family ATPase [Simkaniaceae bacterium]|nr:AAA family ATPase [Simkaniaceae bacterium]
MTKGIFIASNGQNVGKTTSCLGLLSGLRKRFNSIGFMKPVGQEHVETEEGHFVDKDVYLFKEHFRLEDPILPMSPVLFPRGFTRDFLDGKIDHGALEKKIIDSYVQIAEKHEAMLVEGTGHVGVGSIAELNNAHVAKLLGLDVVMIVSGGLGSSFDALALNKQMCDAHGVRVRGVILNRVLENKRTMVEKYLQKALDRWKIPLIGCIPYTPFLSNPCMGDFELLLKAKLLSGMSSRMRHFEDIRLIATSAKVFQKLIQPGMLIITPASREDVIQAALERHWKTKSDNRDKDMRLGFILTGKTPPRPEIIAEIKKSDIPTLYAPMNSYDVMKKIHSHTVKILKEDEEKVHEAIEVVESHVNFDHLLELMS